MVFEINNYDKFNTRNKSYSQKNWYFSVAEKWEFFLSVGFMEYVLILSLQKGPSEM